MDRANLCRLANALVSLLGVADDQQAACVDDYIADQIVTKEWMLLPAFGPVITPKVFTGPIV